MLQDNFKPGEKCEEVCADKSKNKTCISLPISEDILHNKNELQLKMQSSGVHNLNSCNLHLAMQDTSILQGHSSGMANAEAELSCNGLDVGIFNLKNYSVGESGEDTSVAKCNLSPVKCNNKDTCNDLTKYSIQTECENISKETCIESVFANDISDLQLNCSENEILTDAPKPLEYSVQKIESDSESDILILDTTSISSDTSYSPSKLDESDLTKVKDEKPLPPPDRDVIPVHSEFSKPDKPQNERSCSVENTKLDLVICNAEKSNKVMYLIDTESSQQKTNCNLLNKNDDNSTKDKIKGTSAEPYISDDVNENADNNNPEWELLRKLETDAERYRAVRQRWRNLLVPNPNENITFRHAGFCSKQANETIKQGKTKPNISRRKRTHSEISDGREPPGKRVRSQSCIAIFGKKVEEAERELYNEQTRIDEEESRALMMLNRRQEQERRNFYSMNYTPITHHYHANRLRHRQVEDLMQLRKRYTSVRIMAESEKQKKVNNIKNAMEEIRLFNAFYYGLNDDPKYADTMLLSNTEVEDILDVDKACELYETFYRA